MKFLIIFKFGKEISWKDRIFKTQTVRRNAETPIRAKSHQTAATAQKQTTTDAAEIEDDL